MNSWVEPVIALAAAAVGYFQYRSARAQQNNAEVSLVRALTQEWRSLGPEWRLATSIGRGLGNYYSEAEWSQQMRLAALKRRYNSPTFLLPDDAPEDWPVVLATPGHIQAEVDSLPEFGVLNELQTAGASVRSSINFLAQLAAPLSSGKVSISSLYEAFGASILNSAQAVRVLLRVGHYDYMLMGYRDRVLYLIDALWAYGVKVGDVNGRMVAEHKVRSGSGAHNRMRAWRLCGQLGSRIAAVRLVYLLTTAELGTVPSWRTVLVRWRLAASTWS